MDGPANSSLMRRKLEYSERDLAGLAKACFDFAVSENLMTGKDLSYDYQQNYFRYQFRIFMNGVLSTQMCVWSSEFRRALRRIEEFQSIWRKIILAGTKSQNERPSWGFSVGALDPYSRACVTNQRVIDSMYTDLLLASMSGEDSVRFVFGLLTPNPPPPHPKVLKKTTKTTIPFSSRFQRCFC